ncbi:S-adenosylmethionine-dependent methyltransferase [Paenibacillus sp. PastF-1]|uniref:methyltransferase domain-containing protein n=1 Tax=unclassified Paenibacillus TaxID=185978 RepID=UPI0024073D4B|nr:MULTISPECIES: methyltransferase domain-containing protein [unclassified Paenibacillus]MDF9850062.1 S-adenosylmethionine-dependent methyltransferase [Paenibacillus sp. PastM-2]MDF9857734.1 S-adenosylmethionine-dependent methyltransferase [Paenibacillus sp. PastF-1]MDH6483001.1 S-adenosylmethionine-dependent methyltransferase [Paenibacillus sp. PastH-2]MDH6509196.1 S-adenosylmethionine-dependent methyltransferase [Paenibacillus sp. PastM-3]
MNTTAAFSASIEAYLQYTRMPWGRLFYLTAWDQIDSFLTGEAQSILDIGSGFGISSNEYSRRGHLVTGVEPTQEMVAIAAKDGPDVRYINDSFEQVAGGLGTFGWSFCHNILEYTKDPQRFLGLIAGCQRTGGYLSLIAHNPAAKVMKKAILNKEPDSALAAIGNSQEYSGLIQTDYTVYSYEQLTNWLSSAGYEIAGHFGIHNLYGYITDNEVKQDKDWHNRMVQLELTVGRQSPYREIAIFTHIIARKI